MTQKIQLRRGTAADLPTGGTIEGEPRFTIDTGLLYIDDGTKNVLIGGTSYETNALAGYGTSTAFTDATVTAALTALGTTDKATLLLSPGTWTFSANTDYSAYTNITFKLPPGALISHSTYTLNIPNVEAGLYQIFSGTGRISGLRRVSPQWFGAIADGVTDDTAAINKATLAASTTTGDAMTTSVGGRVYIPNGKYLISGKMLVYPGQYIDGESAGGVILYQTDPTSDGIEYQERALGIDQPITIKRIVVSYATAGSAGAGIQIPITSGAASPTLENVTTFQAYDGFSFTLTINGSMKNCYAINSTNDGFAFPLSGGLRNSVFHATACYAYGSGANGWSGYLVGSSLLSVAADTCTIGFNLTASNTVISGSSEACTTGGMLLNGSLRCQINGIYLLPAVGALYGINLVDSKHIVFGAPKISWSGGGTGSYAVKSSGTTEDIQLISPDVASFLAGVYEYPDVISIISHTKGSFTPELSASGATFAYATNGQVGRYTKIGNRVFFSLRIALATEGNTLTSNTMSITGLPYASRNQTNLNSYGTVNYHNIASAGLLFGGYLIEPNNTTINLYTPVSSSTGVTLMTSDFLHATTGSVIGITGSYETD